MKTLCFVLFVTLTNFASGQKQPPLEMLRRIESILLISEPDDPSNNQIAVELYLCEVKQRINLTESNLSIINKSNPVVFIIHGWTETSTRQWYQAMIEAYYTLGDFNIIAVDWSLPAKRPYSISSQNTRKVGEFIGDVIIKMNADFQVPFSNIHVVGHSLGGQTAGFIGKTVFNKTGQKIDRITALDPAGPLFDGPRYNEEDRLGRNDARVVVVIHTDGGYFGMATNCGTIDFYPNGGINLQPGCAQLSYPLDFMEIVFCSHTRSIKYFIESINSKAMIGRKCDSWALYQMGLCKRKETNIFGEHADYKKPGTYYLNTNSKPPYANSD